MDRLKYHVPNRNNVLLHRYPNYFERIVLVLLEDVVLDLIDLEQMRDRTPRERETETEGKRRDNHAQSIDLSQTKPKCVHVKWEKKRRRLSDSNTRHTSRSARANDCVVFS